MSDGSTSFAWLDLCDKALCSPDFEVVHGFSDDEAVTWLHERLARYGHAVAVADVRAALKEWDERPRDEGKTVGWL